MSTTPTLRDALQAARDYGSAAWDDWLKEKVDAALAAPADALAEPVAWMVWWGVGHMRPSWPPYQSRAEAEDRASTIKSVTEVRPIYTAPPAQQLQQAVACAVEECAQLCDKTYHQFIGPEFGEVRHGIAACAAAIRAKGTHD